MLRVCVVAFRFVVCLCVGLFYVLAGCDLLYVLFGCRVVVDCGVGACVCLCVYAGERVCVC